MSADELKALREKYDARMMAGGLAARKSEESADVLALCDALTSARAELKQAAADKLKRGGYIIDLEERLRAARVVALADAAAWHEAQAKECRNCAAKATAKDIDRLLRAWIERAANHDNDAIRIRALAPVPPGFQLVAADVEQRIRARLWLGHCHEGQYGDDGEMQCGACVRFGGGDFKRQPLAELLDVLDRAALAALEGGET